MCILNPLCWAGIKPASWHSRDATNPIAPQQELLDQMSRRLQSLVTSAEGQSLCPLVMGGLALQGCWFQNHHSCFPQAQAWHFSALCPTGGVLNLLSPLSSPTRSAGPSLGPGPTPSPGPVPLLCGTWWWFEEHHLAGSLSWRVRVWKGGSGVCSRHGSPSGAGGEL